MLGLLCLPPTWKELNYIQQRRSQRSRQLFRFTRIKDDHYCKAAVKQMEEVFSTRNQVMRMTAAIVSMCDAYVPMVRLCHILEGDGFLSPITNQILEQLVQYSKDLNRDKSMSNQKWMLTKSVEKMIEARLGRKGKYIYIYIHML